MDGEPVVQKPIYDNRMRRIIWRGWPATNNTIISMISQIETDMLKKEFWFIDGSIGYFINWVKCRGIDLTKTYRSGGGTIRYEEIVFSFLVIDSDWISF